jgi:hypothetical protein
LFIQFLLVKYSIQRLYAQSIHSVSVKHCFCAGRLKGLCFLLYLNYREWGLELCQTFYVFILFGFMGLEDFLVGWGLDRYWDG